MSAQNDFFELIKQISGQKNIVTVPRLFVKVTGDLTQAVILSQCLYWSDKSGRKDGFFYKTAEEFADEFGITARQVRYAADKLEEAGLIITELHRANGSPTTHYKVNVDQLTNSILQICQIEITRLSIPSDAAVNSLTETTTETTPLISNSSNAFGKICKIYENEIGSLTSFIGEEIEQVLLDHPADWIEKAIHKAAEMNKRSWGYVKGILKKWKAQGSCIDSRPAANSNYNGNNQVSEIDVLLDLIH